MNTITIRYRNTIPAAPRLDVCFYWFSNNYVLYIYIPYHPAIFPGSEEHKS